MAVRVETQEIPEGLDGNDPGWDRIILRHNGLEKHFERFPCASPQLREESSVIDEVSPEDLGYAKDEMTVRYGLEDFLTKPFTELCLFHFVKISI
jgi:hypothetical protein